MPVFSVNSASCLKGVIGYIWPLLTLPTKASEVCWYLILNFGGLSIIIAENNVVVGMAAHMVLEQ